MAADPENFGDGRLECTVNQPQTENIGSQNVYTSFLVTTKVAYSSIMELLTRTYTMADRFQDLPSARNKSEEAFHRLRLPIQHPISRIPSCRRPSAAGQTQHVVRARRPIQH